MQVNKVVNLDWNIGVSKYEDNSIDCIITDIPYKMSPRGATRRTGFSSHFSYVKNNDIFGIGLPDKQKMFNEFYRLLKDTSHCYIFAGIYDIEDLLTCAKKEKFKLCNVIVWHKPNIAIVNSYFMKSNEFIFMFRKSNKPAKKINNCSEKDFFDINGLTLKSGKIHPTEKPVELLSKLVMASTNEEDIILDPFAGSGSTGEAAIINNRDFIGFEIDEEMCEKANKRLDKLLSRDI